VDLARQTITTLGNDPRLIAALQQGERELEFREQKRQRQAETVERAHSLLNDGKLSDAALLLKDAIESKLFSSDDLAVRALFEEIGSRRRPPTGSEPQERPSMVSEITLVQLGTDPAREYVFLGGTPLPDAAIHAEQREEIGGIGAESVSKRPAQTSSASPSVMPETPEIGVAREVREQLDLRAVEKHLAISLGPIASFIVDKTAAKAKSQEEFFSQLASSLPSQKDRQIFLAKKKDFVRVQPLEMPVAKAAAVAVGSENRAVTVVPQGARLNPGDISKAVELMAHYVGPISGILAERAARRADNLRGFYLILASHLNEGDERSKFLTDAGFPES
jgi:serine/threonine-protein kinase